MVIMIISTIIIVIVVIVVIIVIIVVIVIIILIRYQKCNGPKQPKFKSSNSNHKRRSESTTVS